MLSRFLRTLAVWYLYYPHRLILLLIGPYLAVRLSRFLALIHWLFTFLGAEGRTRRSLRATASTFTRGVGISGILLRHLQVKHQHFVEWYLYPTERGRKFVRETYSVIEGREHLDNALAEGRGVVLVMYHFGVGKMIFPALDGLGYETYHHVFRGSTYEGAVYGSLALRAMQAMAESEKRSGLRVIYHRPGYTFPLMVRLLKKNAIVGMNADGMTGTEFAETPFLNGRMMFPTGPARLAAVTGAPMVPVFGLHEKAGHRLIAHPRIEVGENTVETVNRATIECAAILESYVKRYPWAWWTWRRLEMQKQADGWLYRAKVNKQDEALYHHENLAVRPGRVESDRSSEPQARTVVS